MQGHHGEDLAVTHLEVTRVDVDAGDAAAVRLPARRDRRGVRLVGTGHDDDRGRLHPAGAMAGRDRVGAGEAVHDRFHPVDRE